MIELAPGLRIAERYCLDHEMAKGGMGAVWAAHDEKLRRRVAVKVLHPKWGSSREARMRFEREAMAVAQLTCAHVVQVFDYGVQDGSPYIVMELLDGEDLQARLKRRRRMTVEETSEVLWQTANALAVAHGAGIVHRDLKPGNVFLARSAGRDETVKVLDFGVAKLVDLENEHPDDERTREGVIVGTPHYMSPEQARGIPGTIDHRADLWSLGVIAYRCVTGRLPFRGRTGTDVIVALLTKRDYLPATRLAMDLPLEADEFFEKALSHDREARFQNAKDLASAFLGLSEMSMPSMRMPAPAPELFNALRIEDAPISTIDTDMIRRRFVLPDVPYDTASSLGDSAIMGGHTPHSSPSWGDEKPTEPPASMRSIQAVLVDSTPPPPRRRFRITGLVALAFLALGAFVSRSLHDGAEPLSSPPAAAPAQDTTSSAPEAAPEVAPTSTASAIAESSASAAVSAAPSARASSLPPVGPGAGAPTRGRRPPPDNAPPPPSAKPADPFESRL